MRGQAERLGAFLRAEPQLVLADVAFSLGLVGRGLEYRAVVLGEVAMSCWWVSSRSSGESYRRVWLGVVWVVGSVRFCLRVRVRSGRVWVVSFMGCFRCSLQLWTRCVGSLMWSLVVRSGS